MTDTDTTGVLHPRYDWLDQARGVVVLFLIISMATAEFSGDMVLGAPISGPPALNHGYKYFDGYPSMITFIDVGQALFVFIMGFVGYTAFTSRLRKRGGRAAFLYATRRVVLLYALSALDAIVLRWLNGATIEWGGFLYGGTFAGIAIGSFAAFLSTALFPRAERRILIAGVLILAQALLYEFPIFDRHSWYDDFMGLPMFPFLALGSANIAIAGSCFGQWHVMDPDNPLAGFRARIVPLTTLAFTANYCMDWIQPAEHHDLPASLQLQAIYSGGLLLMIFFAFGRAGFRFPLLSSFGKNLLLMFALGGVTLDYYWAILPRTMLLSDPLLSLVLVGIAPIAALGCIAVFLDKRGVMVRA